MKQYLDLLRKIRSEGTFKDDRTGVGTYSVFGHQMRFNLNDGFPLVTTKKVFWRGVVEELLWFLRGETNIKSLQEKNVHIWDEWADVNGNLGPVYGAQWRNWKAASDNGSPVEIDQISLLLHELKTNPSSRRMLVSAWNVGELHKMALQPCHAFFQFYALNRKLSCQVYIRSNDCALGAPFNIASYALLLMMVAKVVDMEAQDLVYTIGDAHIYGNHINGVDEQLMREPMSLPQVSFKRDVRNIFDFTCDDIELLNYNHHPKLNFDVAV